MPDNKANPLEPTHAYALAMEKRSPEDAERRMELALLQGGGFVVVMTTQWPGEAEPVSTRFKLSRTGLDMLTSLLSHAHSIRDYPVEAEAQP